MRVNEFEYRVSDLKMFVFLKVTVLTNTGRIQFTFLGSNESDLI